MIRIGENMLYNGLENTIIRWCMIDEIDDHKDNLYICIINFIDKIFLENLDKENKNNILSIIDDLINNWVKDERTAGSLTREIINVMEIFETAILRDDKINEILK